MVRDPPAALPVRTPHIDRVQSQLSNYYNSSSKIARPHNAVVALVSHAERVVARRCLFVGCNGSQWSGSSK